MSSRHNRLVLRFSLAFVAVLAAFFGSQQSSEAGERSRSRQATTTSCSQYAGEDLLPPPRRMPEVARLLE